jgi:choline kinase
MKVVILSAGNSSRMMNLTANIPKSLLPMNGRTILGKQLDDVAKAGLTDVIISAGYKIDQIQQFVNEYNTNLHITVEFNPFFDISNNIISLWNVRQYFTNDAVMIINGDNVFDYQILQKLTDSSDKNVLMVNEKNEYDGDDMKVKSSGNRLFAVNKSMKSSEASAESIGIMKFSRDGTNKLMNKIISMCQIKENLSVWYLRAIQELVEDGVEVNTLSIGDLRWEEVDFPQDYEKVCAMDWD